ncbi:hypothetical protein CBEVV_009 [Choristoneura biennis entomopoxvirus 'L' virophage]|nr:hypothetical protein CBEVV_009 [Choristoneura biennis entomopoxvirus 'L' virophage]
MKSNIKKLKEIRYINITQKYIKLLIDTDHKKLIMKEFCKEHGISTNTLHKYLNILMEDESDNNFAVNNDKLKSLFE